MGMQYHLTRYAFMYESTIVSEGSILCPNASEEGTGLKTIFENIDNRGDFKTYMQNYAVARNAPKGPRREGLYDEGYVPPLPPHVQAAQRPVSPSPPQPAAANGNGASPAPPPSLAPGSDTYVPSSISAATGGTFGVDLGDQLARDGTEVPKVVLRCAEAIEAYG